MSEADQDLEAANAKQIQAKHEMALLVAEQTSENAKIVNQGHPGFQSHTSGYISDQAAQHTVLSVFKSVHSMQSMGCHGVSEQLMAAGATEEDVKQPGCGTDTVRTLETGIATPEPGPEAHSLRAKWWARMKSSPMEYANLDSAKWTPKDKKPSRGVCQTPPRKRGEWRRNASRKEKVCSLLRLWIWPQLIAVPFHLALSRICEADITGTAHATAKLFGEQFEAIGQWATNLTSKSEMELSAYIGFLSPCLFVQMKPTIGREGRTCHG